METVDIEAKHVSCAFMSSRSKQKSEDRSAKRVLADWRWNTAIDKDRPDLGIVTVVLCSLVAFVGVPLLWWFGMTLLQAVILTSFVQLAVFLVIMIISLSLLSRDEEGRLCFMNGDFIAIPDLKIWRSYSQDGANVDAPRIALIAEDSVQTRQIAKDLAQQGYDIHHTTDVDAMFETVQTRPVDWRFMIFDLDLLDDLESNVDDLMMFREECAKIPVLLLSGSISRDEFSDHRRAIGDATLHKPVFRGRLLAGIAAMRTNWQARELT